MWSRLFGSDAERPPRHDYLIVNPENPDDLSDSGSNPHSSSQDHGYPRAFERHGSFTNMPIKSSSSASSDAGSEGFPTDSLGEQESSKLLQMIPRRYLRHFLLITLLHLSVFCRTNFSVHSLPNRPAKLFLEQTSSEAAPGVMMIERPASAVFKQSGENIKFPSYTGRTCNGNSVFNVSCHRQENCQDFAVLTSILPALPSQEKIQQQIEEIRRKLAAPANKGHEECEARPHGSREKLLKKMTDHVLREQEKIAKNESESIENWFHKQKVSLLQNDRVG